MGVVNVTPDSFSDGGSWLDPDAAVAHAAKLRDEGAEVVDVGGESTRPGAEPVPTEVELGRVVPVVERLARELDGLPISIDTQKAAVAAAALDAGAIIVNDVSAARSDPEMLPLVAARGAGLVLMHMQGTPRDMQRDPRYSDVVAEVADFLRARVQACLQAGIDPSRIAVDPGIGFGKRLEHNLELLRRLPELAELGYPLVVGVSRKSFIAQVNRAWNAPPAAHPRAAIERLGGTAAAVAAAVRGGARLLRVHDVAVMGEALRVAAALEGIGPAR